MASEFNIEGILSRIEQNPNISDLHLSAGELVSYRMNGDVVRNKEA